MHYAQSLLLNLFISNFFVIIKTAVLDIKIIGESKNSIMEEIDKLFNEIEEVPVEYKLDDFRLDKQYFIDLEKVLLKLSYHNKVDELESIKESVRTGIKNSSIEDFNDFLSDNKQPTIYTQFDLLKANPNKICWISLSYKKSVGSIELLKTSPNKIDWDHLSFNSHPKAIELLKTHPDKIKWNALNYNNSAFELLKASPDNIDWGNFNTRVFMYYNEKIKALNQLGVFKQIPYFQF